VRRADKRVTILKEFALKHFPAHPVLDYALEVEVLTTKKKPNLIFNVDGCIGCCFVDLLRHCGAFAPEEVSLHPSCVVCVCRVLGAPNDVNS
jgi:ATP citrate (pro-S)-lyase